MFVAMAGASATTGITAANPGTEEIVRVILTATTFTTTDTMMSFIVTFIIITTTVLNTDAADPITARQAFQSYC